MSLLALIALLSQNLVHGSAGIIGHKSTFSRHFFDLLQRSCNGRVMQISLGFIYDGSLLRQRQVLYKIQSPDKIVTRSGPIYDLVDSTDAADHPIRHHDARHTQPAGDPKTSPPP